MADSCGGLSIATLRKVELDVPNSKFLREARKGRFVP